MKPGPDAKRDLDALIKAREEARAELKKTRMEQLQEAIETLRNSRADGRKPARRHPN